MSREVDVSSDEEEKMLETIAKRIHDLGMDLPATLFLEIVKPINYIGLEMGRFYLSPLLMALNDDAEIKSEKIIQILEKRENVEKIRQYLKKLSDADNRDKTQKK